MENKINLNVNNEVLVSDIEERLEDTSWAFKGCSTEIVYVPVGIIRDKEGRIATIFNTDTDLIK